MNDRSKVYVYGPAAKGREVINYIVDESDNLLEAMSALVDSFEQDKLDGSELRSVIENHNKRIPITDSSVYTTHWGSDYTVASRAGRNIGQFDKAVAKRRARNKAARKARRHG